MEEYLLEDSLTGLELGNSTLTVSCAAASLQANHSALFPPGVEIATRSAHILYEVFRLIFGTFLNGLVIVLVAKFNKLRNVSFSIALQIALTNVFLTLLYFVITINVAAGRWIMGPNICVAQACLLFSLFYLRNSLLLVFFLDRFATVFIPFRYPKYRYRTVAGLCILSWCLSPANALVMIPPFLDCYEFVRNTYFCNLSTTCSANCQIFQYVLFITHYIPTLLIPLAIFVALYKKGRKIRSQQNDLLGHNASMTGEDWRALKTFSYLITLAIIFTVAVSGYHILLSQFPHIGPASQFFATLYTLLVLVDPVIILKNGDVREVLGIFFNQIKDSYYQKAGRHLARKD